MNGNNVTNWFAKYERQHGWVDSYEGYSYLEDLMCWAIGIAAAEWSAPHDNIYWQVDFPLYQYEAVVSLLRTSNSGGMERARAISTDSPTEALESLLSTLVGK